MAAKTDSSIGIPKRKFLPQWSVEFTVWMGALALILLLGIYAALQVFLRGLIVTDLDNVTIWGLWIANDNFFIAISAGAFTMATIIYLFKVKRFEKLGRLSVFVGMIGYTVAMMNVILDIGRPERFWHALVYWNPHSMLWEVIISITIYMGVLTLEILPMIAESRHIQRLLPFDLRPLTGKLHRLTPVAALIGLLVSLLHQGSLGGIYSVVRGRPYWNRANVPVMFIFSAVAAGLALIAVVVIMTAVAAKVKLVTDDLLTDLAEVIRFVFLGYVLMRLWDFVDLFYHRIPFRAEAVDILSSTWMFWIVELFLGMLLPLSLLFFTGLRRKRWGLFLISTLIILGAYALRWNILIPGIRIPPMSAHPGELVGTYFPTWIELATMAGTVAAGALFYSLGIWILPLFPRTSAGDTEFDTIDRISTEEG